MNSISAENAHVGSRRLHVLVVDDTEVNLDIASLFLRTLGHRAECVDSGAKAISILAGAAYDLVLMDVRMPHMDGMEATRRMRALPAPSRDIPILAMTAQTLPEQLNACRQAGMNGHLSKPFTKAALYAVLTAVTPGCAGGPQWITGGAGEAVCEAGGADLPVIDLAVFQTNISLLRRESVVSYMRNISVSAGAMLAALTREQKSGKIGAEIADAAHKLAGKVALFGFLRAADTGRMFERAARNGSAETKDLAERFSVELQRTIEEVAERLEGFETLSSAC